MTTAEEFYARVVRRGDCDEWTAGRNGSHGILRWHGRPTPAYRVALVLADVEVPPGFDAHHRCENPLCVRVDPDHVVVITHAEHSRLHLVARGPAAQGALVRASHPSRGPNARAWRDAIADGQRRRHARRAAGGSP